MLVDIWLTMTAFTVGTLYFRQSPITLRGTLELTVRCLLAWPYVNYMTCRGLAGETDDE